MRAGDHLHTDYLADLGRGRRAGIRSRFDGGYIAPEKTGHITAADLFPANQSHVGGLQGRVARFQQGAQAFAFDHSNCLLSHKSLRQKVVD